MWGRHRRRRRCPRLTVKHGIGNVVIVDPRPPDVAHLGQVDRVLSQLVAQLPMVGLMSKSIDLLERMAAESGNVFEE